MNSLQLFSPFIHRDYEAFKNAVGDYKVFLIESESIEKTGTTFARVDNSGIHECLVFRTKKKVTLSTRWSSGGRPFLYGPQQIVLPVGSLICLIPPYHQITRADSWTHLDVSIE